MRRLPPRVHHLGGVEVGGKRIRGVIPVALVGGINITIRVATGVYVGVTTADGVDSGILIYGRRG